MSKKNEKSKNLSSAGYWKAFALFAFFVVIQFVLINKYKPNDTTWKEFKNEMLANNDVERIKIINNEEAAIYIRKDRLGADFYVGLDSRNIGPHYQFKIGSIEVFEQKLNKAEEELKLTDTPEIIYVTETNWFSLILSWTLPFVLILLLWFFLFKGSLGRGAGRANPFDFGKSKANIFDGKNEIKVSFKDVAGLEEAKVEIMEMVDFLKNPARFEKLGAKIPKGVIIIGSPGTGKTLLAKAVAGEANVPFLSISGSEFVEMFVGVGASRVRDLFKKAKEKAPSIIFIDEIDAIGRTRSNALSFQSNDERESTLNQLLKEMDGFDNNNGVIVMAATNRPDILDKALLRPGRFDRHIYLELPSLTERVAIFKVHIKKLSLGSDIDIDFLAHQTPGFSGADIANICNEAALIAARNRKEVVQQKDFSEAIERIIAGIERKSKIVSDKEKRIIAFHEAGHATASWILPNTDELVKVTIIPRGKSLGSAWYLPEEQQLFTKSQLMDRLCMTLGGRAAEEVVFNEVSSGALDDLEKATKQAYAMVAQYGLSEKLGNISFFDSSGKKEASLHNPYSEATAQIIDEEVRNLIAKAYKKTLRILEKNKKELTEIAELLIKKEVIHKKDLVTILGERKNLKSSIHTVKKSA